MKTTQQTRAAQISKLPDFDAAMRKLVAVPPDRVREREERERTPREKPRKKGK